MQTIFSRGEIKEGKIVLNVGQRRDGGVKNSPWQRVTGGFEMKLGVGRLRRGGG